MTLKIRPNAIEQDFGPFTFPGVRLPNDGLHILDTDASHHLVIKPGSNLSTDKILTITTGDAARTITLSGNPTLGDWFDQGVKQADSPTFAGATINGAIALDGDLDFQGAQEITTTAGALTLNPATTLEVTPNANFAAGIDVTGNITVTGTVDGVDIAGHVADQVAHWTTELLQDLVGAMVGGGSVQTLITVSYDDANGELDFVVDNDLSHYSNAVSGFITATLTQEQVEDYVGAMVGGGSIQTLISVTYDDGNGELDFIVDEASIDHGSIAGLGDDDHTIYFLADGSRQLDGDLDFTGPQAITTTAGNLTLNPAGTLEVTPNANFAAGIDVTGNITVTGTVDGIDIATDVAANTTHRGSDGSSHAFLNQAVTIAGTPTFGGLTLAGNLAMGGNDITGLGNIAGSGAEIVVNEVGANIDWRMESDGYAKMFVLDAGADKVDIGTATQGAIASFSNTGIVFNEDSQDRNFRIETSGDANAVFVDGGTNQVIIGAASAADGKLAVYQATGTAIFVDGLQNKYLRDSNDALGFQFTTVKSRAGGATGAGDIIGDFAFNVFNTTPAEVQVAIQRVTIADPTAGSEDVTLQWWYMNAGAGNFQVEWSSSEFVFNQAGLDIDFRVESSSNANMLVVDGGTDRVGIGLASPAATLDVQLFSGAGGSLTTVLIGRIDSRGGASADIPQTLQANYTDSSTANRLSAQCFRFNYHKTAGSTGIPTAFDAGAVLTFTIAENAPYWLIGQQIGGPAVAVGKTLLVWIGLNIQAPSGAGAVTVVNALVIDAGAGGVQIGNPTGGDKGSGSINVSADIWKNNSAYANPDYVLEYWATGKIEKYIENPGARDYRSMTLEEVEVYVREHLHLPDISREPSGAFERGDAALLWLERIITYLIDHEHELAQIEH